MEKGQMQNPANNYPLPLPALLFEFGDISFSNLGEQAQKGTLLVTMNLYHDLVTDSFEGAELENFTINMLNRFDGIYRTFETFGIPGITPLNRTVEYKPAYGKRYILFKVEFRTTIDQAVNAAILTAKLTPKFSTNIK